MSETGCNTALRYASNASGDRQNMVATPKRDYHMSDCSTHNEPAYPNGPCDCRAKTAERVETLREQMESMQEVATTCNHLAQQIAYALFGVGAPPCNPTGDALSIRERLNLAYFDMTDCRSTLREILERVVG